MTRYHPDPKILTLGPDFYDPVQPARFPQCTQRFVNARWAERVGLAPGEEQWAAHFCRFEPLPENLGEPLALRYHGHQFRVYNPEIGDGRGFLFAQLRDDRGRLLDLGTKGSGQTPYSRHADGRLTLKGGVREVLATEMLEALGVNTSKTFALFETGEALERGDEPSPTRSAVLTRLSHGHIRIGTFQRLAFFGDAANIAQARQLLPREPLRRAPAADDGENALRLFDLVGRGDGQARRLLPRRGVRPRRAQHRQHQHHRRELRLRPVALHARLGPGLHRGLFRPLRALRLRPAAGGDPLGPGAARGLPVAGTRAPPLADMLAGWSERFEHALVEAMLRRLGVGQGRDDRELAAALIAALASREATIDRVFFDWRGGRDPGVEHYPSPPFRALANHLQGRATRAVAPILVRRARPARCTSTRSRRSGRRSPSSDDWQPLTTRSQPIRQMGEAMEQDAPAG